MSLKDRLPGVGPGVMFHPGLMKITDHDLESAILLCQLIWWAERTDGPVSKSAKAIEERTGLTRRRQERARKRLERSGVIDIELRGMPARLAYDLKWAAIDERWSVFTEGESKIHPKGKASFNESGKQVSTKPESMVHPKVEAFLDLETSREDREAYRGVDHPRVARSMLKLWAESWGKDPDRVRMTRERRESWNRALREGRSPKDFAKAIIGMTHDPWPDRDSYCDWSHVVRSFERWVSLAEANDNRAAIRPGSLGFPTKIVEGVVVPADYDWREGDTFCRRKGERFDPRERKWVPQSHPMWGALGSLNGAGGRQ